MRTSKAVPPGTNSSIRLLSQTTILGIYSQALRTPFGNAWTSGPVHVPIAVWMGIVHSSKVLILLRRQHGSHILQKRQALTAIGFDLSGQFSILYQP